MDPQTFSSLSREQTQNWAREFKNRFGKAISDSAHKHCVPKRLLAAIIANELTDFDLLDGTMYDGMGGGGIGVAQISVKTAQEVLGIYDNLPANSFDQPGEIQRRILEIPARLSTDAGAADIAGALLKKFLDEMCAKAKAGLPGGAKAFFSDCNLGDFCCRSGDCATVENMTPSKCLIRAASAYWNTNGRDGKPSVLDAKDPINTDMEGGNFFGAGNNGKIAESNISPLLNQLVP